MRALKVSYSDVGEGGVAVNCEKTQFFLNTMYITNLKDLQMLLHEKCVTDACEYVKEKTENGTIIVLLTI